MPQLPQALSGSCLSIADPYGYSLTCFLEPSVALGSSTVEWSGRDRFKIGFCYLLAVLSLRSSFIGSLSLGCQRIMERHLALFEL